MHSDSGASFGTHAARLEHAPRTAINRVGACTWFPVFATNASMACFIQTAADGALKLQRSTIPPLVLKISR